MRWLLLIFALFAAGCGEGYVMPQAATRVEFASSADLDTAFAATKAYILGQGFEQIADEPPPEFMLENKSSAMRWRTLHAKYFWRDRGSLFDREQARIFITPYPDASADYQAYNGYSDAQPHWPFLEIHISESRPDGFSAGTLQFYDGLVQSLSSPNTTIVNLASPRTGSPEVYKQYVLSGLAQLVVWWLVAWCISLAIIGRIATWLFGFFDWSRRVRRLAFVVVGGLLATPLPVPTMFVTLLLPNMLVFWAPELYAELSRQSGLIVAAMFVTSFALSGVAAIVFIRKRKQRSLTSP